MSQDGRQLRASDEERQRVAAYLQQAMSLGYLTADELSERVDTALRARTRGELDDIAGDLPGAPQVTEPEPEPVLLRGSFGAVKRKGSWEVPGTLHLNGRLSSFELDFSQASIEHSRVDVVLDVIGCSVELRLPEGASAATDELESMLASVQDHRKGAATGGPHFRIRGAVRLGSVELRGPRPAWLNWLGR